VSALAQTSDTNTNAGNERAAGAPGALQAPVANINARKAVSLIVTISNKKTGRALGDVSLNFTDLTTQTTNQTTSQNSSYKIPDPPTPEGYTISSILSGQYEVIAKRTGYEISDEKITISADKQYYQLKIELTPLVGTPQPDQQNYAYLENNSVYNPSYNYPYSSNYPYSNQNPNYQGYPSYPNNYPSNLNYPSTNYPYSNTYYQTANQGYTVPLQIMVLTQLSNYQLPTAPQVQIIDPTNNNQIILTSSQFQTSSGTTLTGGTGAFNQFGCLEPYHQYIVYVAYSGTLGIGTSQKNQPFQTGPQGQPVQITIDSRYLSNYSPINISLSSTGQQLPITCPNFATTNTNYPGSTVWTDPNINLSNFNNYTVFHSPTDGKYYLINRQNQFDMRPITFVDKGDGLGGLAFIPAQSGTYGNNIYSYAGTGSSWYVTIYTRDNSGNLNLPIQSFSAVKFSPQDYANAVHSQVTNSFAG
jgi:hypothetical protein